MYSVIRNVCGGSGERGALLNKARYRERGQGGEVKGWETGDIGSERGRRK